MESGRRVSIARWAASLLVALAVVACSSIKDVSPEPQSCGAKNQACCTDSKCNTGLICTSRLTCEAEAACRSAPTSNRCTMDPKYPVDCVGDGSACCPASAPFSCNGSGRCYATQADALQECGDSCQACNTATPSSACQSAPTTNRCTKDPQYPADCGFGCCPKDLPFACERLGKCYATLAEASTACGDACQACNMPSSTCQAAPTTNRCTKDPQYPADCGFGCCPKDLPFACERLGKCYATLAEASTACGDSCQVCQTGI